MKRRKPAKTRILIVEDHRIVRQGIARLINEEADLEVCAEAGEAGEALKQIAKDKPDLVIIDISLPGMNGIEFLKHLKVEHPGLPAVVLSMHDEALYAERALRAGASAYVMKKESSDELLVAIRKAREGQFHVSEKVGGSIFQKFVGTKRPVESAIGRLSDRELEVFELLGHGHGSKEIARQLRLSVKTVDTHRGRIKEKLSLRGSTEMIQRAVQWVERENHGG
ncbi:MAG: response regulator transcription factor [Chthoniobacter sp.]|nr:response regulator transcription factor [Chthoniobacter sp.]